MGGGWSFLHMVCRIRNRSSIARKPACLMKNCAAAVRAEGWYPWSRSCKLCSALRMRSSKTCVHVAVVRRCLVCEHEDELEEPEDTDEIGPLCSSCSAPTERVAIRARRTRPV